MNFENAMLKRIGMDVEGYAKLEHDKGFLSMEDDHQWSYLTEIFLILSKSLRPSETEEKVFVDTQRWQREMALWKDYRHGQNEVLMSMEKPSVETYLNGLDNSLMLRAWLIAYVNKRRDYCQNEILKHILETSGQFHKIIASMVFGMIVNDYLNRYSLENAIERSKEWVIRLKPEQFFKQFDQWSKIPKDKLYKNPLVAFEKARIQLIMELDGEETASTLEKLEKRLDSPYGNWAQSFEDLAANNCEILEVKDKKIILNFIQYLIKLREGRIDPQNIKAVIGESVDIFGQAEGLQVNHDLLGLCKILKKGENSKYIKLLVETKTGIYRFLKIK